MIACLAEAASRRQVYKETFLIRPHALQKTNCLSLKLSIIYRRLFQGLNCRTPLKSSNRIS